VSEATQPQAVQFETQAPYGAVQHYGADWVAYALNTEAPAFVGGVDHSLNPALPGAPGAPDGGTAYA
jgi:hypothetical protein